MTTKAEKPTKTGSTAHFVLQGKGGVGKSLIASFLAQYFKEQSKNVKAYDTDVSNATLTNYKGIGATYLPLLGANKRLDERKFDELMEDLLSIKGTTFVVDSGSNTFLQLASYMAENQAYDMLAGAGVELTTHTVVTGGQALKDTLVGLDSLCKLAADKGVVVWINEFWGPVTYEGTPFTELPVFKNNADKIKGTVTIQNRNADTFGKDVTEMVSQNLTFAEVMDSPDVKLMAKSRLRLVKQDIFEQLTAIGLQ